MKKFLFGTLVVYLFQLPVLASETCVVRLIDSTNLFEVDLGATLTNGDKGEYEVTDKLNTKEADSVKVCFEGPDQVLKTNVGVPETTRLDLIEFYEDKILSLSNDRRAHEPWDDQIAWELPEGSSCDWTELALIFYLVDQWFYYN